jgi:hypothetical protein
MDNDLNDDVETSKQKETYEKPELVIIGLKAKEVLAQACHQEDTCPDPYHHIGCS